MQLLKRLNQRINTISLKRETSINTNGIVLRFYSSINGCWYVDMPAWEGSIDALEMVRGVDELLQELSNDTGNDVFLKVSIFPFINSTCLLKLQDDNSSGGAYYSYPSPFGPKIIWLCSVSNWFFGHHPCHIYFENLIKYGRWE